jgi:formamidopyrimidine-DNA glycosylase
VVRPTLILVPELPEVESARAVLERKALHRSIADVDDTDTYICRPHSPGEIRAALLDHELTVARRQGKNMWCETAGPGGPGPILGIHLGMSGRIVFNDGKAEEIDGGDYWERGRAAGDYRFTRFRLSFGDGSFLLMIDPRRLGRVRLDPPVEKLGPDARSITRDQFRAAMARGTIAVKARLLDQEALAGIGNILADQVLWLAKVKPAKPVDELSRPAVDRLFHAVHEAVEDAVEQGGVHKLGVVPARTANGTCPRCGTPMKKGTVGGRTTFWCPKEQR